MMQQPQPYGFIVMASDGNVKTGSGEINVKRNNFHLRKQAEGEV